MSRIAAFCLSVVLAGGAAASQSPEMQAKLRGATFEVVLRKSEVDPLAYEKPLPMELVPFALRNDSYWSATMCATTCLRRRT